jgi:putative SOS response-associated peptidase YedK
MILHHNTNVFDDPELAATYNAAPGSCQPVIRLNSETGEREIAPMKWGLVPYWSKAARLNYKTSNAVADNLTSSGLWREPFKHRRCLVPADWFYEWPVVDGEKQAAHLLSRTTARLPSLASGIGGKTNRPVKSLNLSPS